ncbi:MAG TPA: sulfatase-like hydrolase/transferase, partial [Thermoanaerobaculia bacterium]
DVERDPALPSAGMGAVQRNGAQTIAVADRWIATNAGKPFFFFLHLYEPHSPYDPPEPYASRYRPYDGEIAHTDELIGRFIEGLKARGIYDDALLVFFSDHGEGLNDHGEEEHGIFLYREALQVPLFIKLPKGERQGESVSDPVQLSDIFPTVLEAATLTNESPSLAHAESLMNFGSATRPPRRIYSETYFPRFHFGWSDLHSLVDSDHHYIQAPQAELFDLRADPAERTNVLADQRRVYASMRNAIAPLVKEAAAPAPISAEEAAKLAALGYLGSAPASSDDDLPDPKTKVETFREIRAAFKLMRSGQYLEALAFYERLLRENPRMLDLWDVRARILMRLGRLDEAVASAKEGFKLSPQSTHLALLIATLSLERGDLEQSEQHAALAVKDHPGEAHEVLARVALARGDVTRAEAEARAALAEGDDRVRSLMILARIARERRDFESALTSITQAAALSEKKKVDVIGLHFLRGDILARLGRSTEAEHAFREEMREFPEEPQAYANLIVLLVADGRTAEATQVIHDLEKAAPTPPAYAAISNTLKVVGDERGARFWAVRGLKKYPRDPALRKLAG